MEKGMEALENQVMRMLLEGDGPTLEVLRYQFAVAKRRPREMTGVGFFLEFDVPEEAPRLPGNVSLRFGDVIAEIEGIQHGAGFLVFVDDGVLTMLEGYTYDEPWPNVITSFKLQHDPE